jgi:hypothetical protein
MARKERRFVVRKCVRQGKTLWDVRDTLREGAPTMSTAETKAEAAAIAQAMEKGES